MSYIRLQHFLFLLLASVCGCSASPATVVGKVTTGGAEMTGGGIVFSPVPVDGDTLPGKPGSADIRSDGTYSLEIEPGPNGLAKRFAVLFSPPPLPLVPEEEAKANISPYRGLVPKQSEVEIKPGANVIDIELVRPVKN